MWLTLQGRVASAHCQRSRRGPLDRAQETGRRYGVGDRITFRLGNGLAAVAPEECDTIVIAGMGGENIAQILAGGTLDPPTARHHSAAPAPEPGGGAAPLPGGARLRP